jgi:hypothetical protein
MLSLGPSPRLLRGPPDVRSSLGRAGIAGEVVVFKGAFDTVLGHAVGIRGDTQWYPSEQRICCAASFGVELER